jgi:hypothetical protein
LRQFIIEAVEEKLKNSSAVEEKPWMKHLGKLKHLHKGSIEIDRFIEEAFEQIDPEMWELDPRD